MSATAVKDIGELGRLLERQLAAPPYADQYETEAAFEVEVWKRVVSLAKDLGLDLTETCLTSHAIHVDRSVQAWETFRKESAGPDVEVLDSNNRLDIVFKHPQYGSIGIEVKCLGRSGHSGKLTQGLGQALLGLANRDRTMLVVHCGAVSDEKREQLRGIARRICDGLRTVLIVVP